MVKSNLITTLLMLSFCALSPALRKFGSLRYPVAAISKLKLSSAARPPSNALSLDGTLLASDVDLVTTHLQARHVDSTLIAEVLKVKELRLKRNTLIEEGDKARNLRKTLSKSIGQLMKEKREDEIATLKQQVDDATSAASNYDEELTVIDQTISSIIAMTPNLLDDRVPYGKSDADNVVVSSWGEDERKLGEGFKWHDDIAADLGGIDNDAAAKISGSRFSVLVGPVAQLERALVQYFLNCHISRGYTEVSVPYIVSRSTLEGTGQLPKFEDDLFRVNHQVGGEDAFLIPTAEVPVTNLFRDSILNATDLPISLCSYSPAFRAEAGSYGRDTRGLLRQHQFHKVELVKICTPETSAHEHEKMSSDAEELLRALKLPYRKMLLCSGDTGFSARICYDLEVWLPGQQAYREISSCSNCYDFQARRMGLRYRQPLATPTPAGKGKQSRNVFAHTLNGSGLAVGRTLVAILENYQLPDGSVDVPEVLQPYMGGVQRLSGGSTNFVYARKS